jgi:hypothetical protein
MRQCVSGSLNPNLFTVNVAVFTEPINSGMVIRKLARNVSVLS